MKGSYFGFGLQQQVMQGQKTLSLSYNMHSFLPYLHKDSQTICSTIHFSKPLLCVTLICSDWSIGLILISPDKAVFSSATLCTAPGKTVFLPLQKQHLVEDNEFAFSFRPTWKDQQVAGNMLMFHVESTGIGFKNDSFQWFRVDSFIWETITLYMEHFQISIFAGCFHSQELLHCMKDHFQKSIEENIRHKVQSAVIIAK